VKRKEPMKTRKVLPVLLAGSIIGEMLISARDFDSTAPHAHVEFEITAPFVSSLSTVSTGMASVIYSSSCFADKNGGGQGHMTEPIKFPSIEAAMCAPFPIGYESATLWTERGRYAYHSPRFAWEPC
jgi:hypothetical protein